MGSNNQLAPSLVIRCDANPQIGFGHLIRCLDIARGIKKTSPEIPISFWGKYYIDASKLLRSEGFLFSDSLSSSNPFVLVDSYTLDETFYTELNNKNLDWGYIDDEGNNTIQGAKLVFNFRINAESMFQYPNVTQALLGADYFPIHSDFQHLREQSQTPNSRKIKQILICMGGDDRFQASVKLTQDAHKVFPDAHILLVSSLPCPSASWLTKRSFATNFHQLFDHTDLILTGGGRLKYEAAFCRIFAASLSQTDLQMQDSQILEEHNLCLNLGSAEHYSSEQVTEKLETIKTSKYQQAFWVASDKEFKLESTQNLASELIQCIKHNYVPTPS